MITDTIAAVSTPRGKGGVALLRVSGKDAVAISARVFNPKNGKTLAQIASRTAVYGSILAPGETGSFEPVDDGIATIFRAPASFTGEDTVEICCHGGMLITETVLTALFAAGARPAEAGEFTRRSFLNGKLGLSEAEALGDLLEASTRGQITLAHNGMSGRLGDRSGQIYEKLRDILSAVYVTIDYPDEDLADMSREEIGAAFADCSRMLDDLIRTYRTGHAVAEGISTVICGKPNVGKSSLYNRIVGKDAAIVTDVEGTTRDVLTERAALGSVTLSLFDTAGLHESADTVEKIGMDRARKAMESAELILAVFDVRTPPTKEDADLLDQLQTLSATVIVVGNKRDGGDGGEAFYRTHARHFVPLSAKSGDGMKELTETVERLFTDGSIDLRNDAILSNARQHAAALSAKEAVDRAGSALQAGAPLDVCCAEAESAMAAISEMDGRAVSEDIVSAIFAHFCVGK